MIVEQRIYTLIPGTVKSYIDYYVEQGRFIQLPHLGRFLGYYYSEFGTLNQVIHMWAYSDLAERDLLRAQQNADSAWSAYATTARKIIVAQENHALKPVGAWATVLNRFFNKPSDTKDLSHDLDNNGLPKSAVVEFSTIRLKWGATDAYLQNLERYESTAKPIGLNHIPAQYLYLSGNDASLFTFQIFGSFDERDEHHRQQSSCASWALFQKAIAEQVVSRDVRIMKPFAFCIPELGILRRLAADQSN